MGRDRLLEASLWEGLTWGKLSLIPMDGANLSKSLVQFSVDGQGCVLSLLFGLRSNYGRDHYCYNSDLLQKDLNACIVEYIVVFSAPVPVGGHC